jgi:hypothetical protein
MTDPNTPFASNSHKARMAQSASIEPKKPTIEVGSPGVEAAPEIKKVISGGVSERKKTLGQKIAATFTGDDARSVGNYILFDLVLPAVRDMFVDSIQQGAERFILGENRPRTRSGFGSGGIGPRPGHVAYNKMGPTITVGGREPVQAEVSNDIWNDIVLDTRGDAEVVLDGMMEIVHEYGIVSVSNLFELIGKTCPFTYNKIGWNDLSRARAVRVRDGRYWLELPRPSNID